MSTSLQVSPKKSTSEAFVRSGGGLQGLLWSQGRKDSADGDARSPADKLKLRHNSEPEVVYDQGKPKCYESEYVPSSLKPRAMSMDQRNENDFSGMDKGPVLLDDLPTDKIPLYLSREMVRVDSFEVDVRKQMIQRLKAANIIPQNEPEEVRIDVDGKGKGR